jgi:hypothetical protein
VQVTKMSTSHAQNALPVHSNGALLALVRRSLQWGNVALTAAWRHVTVADVELKKARESLRRSKRALREAEIRFDRDCGVNPMPLIIRIKVAEARVQRAPP